MAAPIIAAAIVARYLIKNGFKMAVRKYGRKATEKASELAHKSKPLPKGKKITSSDKFSLGSNNPAPQQAKPARMPKQKNTQGPKNPKGMGFSAGGKVNNTDYRKKGMFK